MDGGSLVGLFERTLLTLLATAGPVLVATLVVGLVVSVFQAATQINEATLTFVPKLLVVAAILVLFGPAMIGALTDLTRFVLDVAATSTPAYGR